MRNCIDNFKKSWKDLDKLSKLNENWEKLIGLELSKACKPLKIEQKTLIIAVNHPQFNLAKSQMKSGGSMITLKLNLNKSDTFKFCKSLRYFSLAESLGGVESLICHPATMTHASVDDKTKNLLGIDDSLIRLSVGCEDTNDLISDILFALNKF